MKEGDRIVLASGHDPERSIPPEVDGIKGLALPHDLPHRRPRVGGKHVTKPAANQKQFRCYLKQIPKFCIRFFWFFSFFLALGTAFPRDL